MQNSLRAKYQVKSMSKQTTSGNGNTMPSLSAKNNIDKIHLKQQSGTQQHMSIGQLSSINGKGAKPLLSDRASNHSQSRLVVGNLGHKSLQSVIKQNPDPLKLIKAESRTSNYQFSSILGGMIDIFSTKQINSEKQQQQQKNILQTSSIHEVNDFNYKIELVKNDSLRLSKGPVDQLKGDQDLIQSFLGKNSNLNSISINPSYFDNQIQRVSESPKIFLGSYNNAINFKQELNRKAKHKRQNNNLTIQKNGNQGFQPKNGESNVSNYSDSSNQDEYDLEDTIKNKADLPQKLTQDKKSLEGSSIEYNSKMLNLKTPLKKYINGTQGNYKGTEINGTPFAGCMNRKEFFIESDANQNQMNQIISPQKNEAQEVKSGAGKFMSYFLSGGKDYQYIDSLTFEKDNTQKQQNLKNELDNQHKQQIQQYSIKNNENQEIFDHLELQENKSMLAIPKENHNNQSINQVNNNNNKINKSGKYLLKSKSPTGGRNIISQGVGLGTALNNAKKNDPFLKRRTEINQKKQLDEENLEGSYIIGQDNYRGKNDIDLLEVRQITKKRDISHNNVNQLSKNSSLELNFINPVGLQKKLSQNQKQDQNDREQMVNHQKLQKATSINIESQLEKNKLIQANTARFNGNSPDIINSQLQELEDGRGILSFFKDMFAGTDNFVQQDPKKLHANKMGQRGGQSAETKASSSQSIMALGSAQNKNFDGWTPQEALEIFGSELTEFEKIELGIYERIYTIGKIRRQNQYSIADKEGFYIAQEEEQLGYRYKILKIVDQGAFGQVVKCIDMKDPKQRIVAAKIGKNKKFDIDNANVEVTLLKKLRDSEKKDCTDFEGKDRIVTYLESFKFRQHVVIIFEFLNFNLYKYMKVNKLNQVIFEPNHLKRISFQMLQGLKYMKNQTIIHCDLKPENVLFTDESFQNIKIIDFGASCQDCNTGFFYVQSRYYRAPEIILGIQYDHAVDMWSLGCIIYELITGKPLFPGQDENEMLEYFIVTIEKIPSNMLKNAKKYKQFYKKTSNFLNLSSYNHELIRCKESRLGNHIVQCSQTIQMLLQDKSSQLIIDFIQKCLVIDPEQRIKPQQALQHPWFKQ